MTQKNPQNFITQKIFIFWNPPKILKFTILNPKKCPKRTYVWNYQSTPPPPPWTARQQPRDWVSLFNFSESDRGTEGGGHSYYLLYPLFSLEKKGILISCQSRSVVRPSVRLSVCPCVRPSVTFLVNVSPPKPLEVATSNFVGE